MKNLRKIAQAIGATVAGLLLLPSIALATVLLVPQGGTGLGTMPLGSLLLGNGTAAINALSPGASGTILKSNGAGVAPSWAVLSGLGLTTTDVPEGTNLYFTNARVGSYIAGSTTLPALLNYWTASGGDVYRLSGNVGIGTTTPDNRLVIETPSTGSGITFDVAGTHIGTIGRATVGTAVSVAFDSAASNRPISINNAVAANTLLSVGGGNVGVGSSTPNSKLSVQGSGTGTGSAFQITNSSNTPEFNVADNGVVTALTSFGNLGGSSAVLFPTGRMQFNSGGAGMLYLENGSNVHTKSDSAIGWGSNTSIATAIDTGFSRLGAGIVGVGNGAVGNVSGTLIANTIGIGSSTPSAKLSILDQSGGDPTTTLLLSLASSSPTGLGTTTLFSVLGTGSTTISGALRVSGGSFTDNNGKINLGIGMSGVNKAKCGFAVMDNFAASCAAQNGAFFGVNISNDTNYAGYNAASFQKGSNVNGLNSAGANALFFTAQVNTTNNDTAGFWNQTQTTNAINTATSYAYVSQNYLQGTGQLGNYAAFKSGGSYATAGPTVTNQYDFRADPFGSLSNGTTTNRYGLYLGYDNTSITNAYGVYQLSPTVKNYFAGNVGLGSTSPVARLAIVGGVGSTTDLFAIASSSNTQYLTVKSNGNVGFGTTTPTATLGIQGTAGRNLVDIASSSGASMFSISPAGAVSFNNSPGTAGYVLQSFGAGLPAQWVATSSLGITGGGGGTNYWSSSGASLFNNTGELIGLGTSTPSSRLSLAASTTPTGGINLGDALANLYRSYDGMIRTDGGFTAGGGQFIVNGTGSITSSPGATFSNIYLNGTNVTTIPSGIIGFTPANWYDAPDTAISRLGANKLAIGNGTAGNVSGTLIAANLGLGSSTPSKTLTVVGDQSLSGAFFDSTFSAGTAGMVLQTTATGTQWVATSSLNISGGSSQWTTTGSSISYSSGRVGIGTTSPFGIFSIASTSYSYLEPLFNVSTSTGAIGDLFQIWSSTTTNQGVMPISGYFSSIDSGVRIAIGGFKSYFGLLLDQVNINGRINTGEWFFLECSTHTALGGVSADTAGACGPFQFQVDSAGSFSASSIPGSVGTLSAVSAGNGAGLFDSNSTHLRAATSTPILEAAVMNTGGDINQIGFVDTSPGGTSFGTVNNGCYFEGTPSSANWQAICKNSTGVTVTTDTGIVMDASNFQRLRVEMNGSVGRFYIQEKTTGWVLVATNSATTTAGLVSTVNHSVSPTGSTNMQVGYIRLWFKRTFSQN